MQQPVTQEQYQTILTLQGRLGGSQRFAEPRLVYGEHPKGWRLTSESAAEMIRLLHEKLLREAHTNPVPV